MMPAPKLSPAQYDKIAELIEKGTGTQTIADRFKISLGTVYWTGLRLGADCPKHRRQKSPNRPTTYLRKGKPVRQFTDVEDATLLQLEQSGIKIARIADRMDRKPNSIRGRLMTLARKDARQEEAG